MKKIIQKLIALATCIPITASAVAPYFAFRSQSVNAMREIVGEQTLINRYGQDCCYCVLAITPEFTRTFKPGNLAACIFGADAGYSDCGGSIKIAGSLTSAGGINTDRGTAWLADYFGLPRDYSTVLSFEPKIWNFNLDINMFIGLDEWAKGLYFKIHAPLTYSRWDLNFCGNCACQKVGTNGYDEGYFATTAIPAAALYQSATDFFTGVKATPVLGNSPADGLPIVFEPLQYSTFSNHCDGNGICRLSDIEAALGWNFHLTCDSHVGAEIRTSAPVGNKPCAQALFMPVVGSGGQWKLGAGISAHKIFWKNGCDEKSLGLWLYANAQHLFDACQDRVFDLCGKPNSRYMLAEKMVLNQNPNGLAGGASAIEAIPSTYVFAGQFAPVANLTHRQVNVSVPIEGDIVVKFSYMCNDFEWDLGYEFWGRSCEEICKNKKCSSRINQETWALKGDAYVYGNYGPAPIIWTPLGASESEATINAGTNYNANATLDPTNPNAAFYNPSIDGAQPAFFDGFEINSGTGGRAHQTRTSIQTIILTDSDVGYKDAQTMSFSNKVFTNLGYTWREDCDVITFFSLGASAEFAPSCTNTTCVKNPIIGCPAPDEDCNDTCCTPGKKACCQKCGLNQWAVWLKGGFSW